MYKKSRMDIQNIFQIISRLGYVAYVQVSNFQ